MERKRKKLFKFLKTSHPLHFIAFVLLGVIVLFGLSSFFVVSQTVEEVYLLLSDEVDSKSIEGSLNSTRDFFELLFGISLAFAGAYVAIKLAKVAISISENEYISQETSIRLSAANQYREQRQRVESALFNAASEVRRFLYHLKTLDSSEDVTDSLFFKKADNIKTKEFTSTHAQENIINKQGNVTKNPVEQESFNKVNDKTKEDETDLNETKSGSTELVGDPSNKYDYTDKNSIEKNSELKKSELKQSTRQKADHPIGLYKDNNATPTYNIRALQPNKLLQSTIKEERSKEALKVSVGNLVTCYAEIVNAIVKLKQNETFRWLREQLKSAEKAGESTFRATEVEETVFESHFYVLQSISSDGGVYLTPNISYSSHGSSESDSSKTLKKGPLAFFDSENFKALIGYFDSFSDCNRILRETESGDRANEEASIRDSEMLKQLGIQGLQLDLLSRFTRTLGKLLRNELEASNDGTHEEEDFDLREVLKYIVVNDDLKAANGSDSGLFKEAEKGSGNYDIMDNGKVKLSGFSIFTQFHDIDNNEKIETLRQHIIRLALDNDSDIFSRLIQVTEKDLDNLK